MRMFGRSKKPEPEQGRGGRQAVRQSGAPSPAFSYYAKRTPEPVTGQQSGARQDRAERHEPATGKARPRLRFAQIPFWLLMAVLAVCIIKVLLLGTNPKVVVVGKNTTAANYLQSTTVYATAGHAQLASSVLNRSKLTVNLDGIAAALERQFPELQTVSVDVPLVGTRPIIYVEVAQPSVIVQTTSGNYALNASGIVLAKLHSIPAGVPVVVDQSADRPTPGKQFLPGSTVSFVQAVAYQCAAAQLSISAFVLPANAPYELDVRPSGQPYRIRMNLTADARTQSGAALATLQQLGTTAPTDYLDVRTPQRAYYK